MTARKTALITGIDGQDGAYLAQFLRGKGYNVHGVVRWESRYAAQDFGERLSALGLKSDDVSLHYGDITDAQALTVLIKAVHPDEIYHLAALSHVAVSFQTPAAALEANTKGALAVFEAVRLLDRAQDVRIYQASSSEMFGQAPAPQNETTPFAPCSPYGVAKLAAYWLGRVYRESYGMFIANGILFNHESPLRGQDFVTRKISIAVAEFALGLRDAPLALGNLDSLRDWGHARDYVEGMWRIVQHRHADDFILATGQARSVRDFAQAAFAHIGMDILWEGQGLDEIGRDSKTGKILVTIDPQFFRPLEVHHLLGDATKAREILGWQPTYHFESLVRDMVEADVTTLKALRR